MEPRSQCLSGTTVFNLLAGRVDGDELRVLHEHLGRCRSCAAALEHSAEGAPADWVSNLAVSLGRGPMLASDLVIAERYRMVRFIGKGGMGEVYEAEDLLLGKRIAIKMLSEALARDPLMVARLKREVQLAHKVTHPNVCRIFDLGYHRAAGVDEPLAFITMELLDGETLRQRLQRTGRFPTEAARAVVLQVADALGAAHAAGVVHRDLKSDNVLLVDTPTGPRAFVTDFGLARAVIDDDAPLSAKGTLVGTAAYMAPEQVLGEPVTAAADVYALGVVMFELVTGELPFRGATPIATAFDRLQRRPPSPRTIVPSLDPIWEAVIARCLMRAPADRFARVEDVVLALTARSWRRPGAGSLGRRALAVAALTAMVGATFGLVHALTGPRAPAPVAAPSPSPPPPSLPLVTKTSATIARATPARTQLLVHADGAHARLTIDSRDVALVDGVAAVDVEPESEHLLVVVAPGRLPWRKSIVAPRGGTLELSARPRRATPAPAASAVTPAPAARAPLDDDDVVDPYHRAH
jgi:tRNA A-37 threonylcarbamoyl transferase component Bud32